MATSHYCNGIWRDGTLAECTKHKGLSKKQTSVYRSPDKDPSSKSKGSSSSSKSKDSGSSSKSKDSGSSSSKASKSSDSS